MTNKYGEYPNPYDPATFARFLRKAKEKKKENVGEFTGSPDWDVINEAYLD